jgi:beta-galactosidase
MGFNSLSVYIMWNYHEVSKGIFDYKTDNKNLPLFLDLAKKYGFFVLIRPGPYVCAEWDFGGLPARLLQDTADRDADIRQNTPGFMG